MSLSRVFIGLFKCHPVLLSLLYFAMFHAWSTVLKEQVGGLIKVLIYPTSQDEVVELSQTVGGTNLGCHLGLS